MDKRINLHISEVLIDSDSHQINFIQELIKVLQPRIIIPEYSKKDDFVNSSSEDINLFFLVSFWLFKNTDYYSSIKGKKYIIEFDGYKNFLPFSGYYGARSNFYEKNRFDLLLSSGKLTTEKFMNESIPTLWIPKGFNKKYLTKENTGVGSIGYLGSSRGDINASGVKGSSQQFPEMYASRYEMANLLCGYCDLIQTVPLDYAEVVSKYSGIFLNDSTMNEPMAKHFEISGLGVVPIRDKHSELYDLGYDDKSMIEYDSLNDIPDIINHLSQNQDHLLQMQKNTREIARNHTWEHRAKTIKNIIYS